MRTTILSLLPALALLTAACDGGEAKKTETKVVTKVETKTTVEKTETKEVVAAEKPAEPAAPAPDSPEGKVQLAAAVAKEISAAPEQADDILGKHGLDRTKFDAIIFEIAGDPELTKKYMAARRTS